MALALGCGGGSLRVGAANPRPQLAFGPSAPRYSVDVSRVQDTLYFDKVTVRDFRSTLSRGFANGFGTHFANGRGPDTMHLLVDGVEGSSVQEGRRTVMLRFRARWLSPSGEVITAFEGVAMPRDDEAYGKKNVEDVVAVMIERMVGALVEAGRRAPPTPPPPVDTTPRLPPNKPPGT